MPSERRMQIRFHGRVQGVGFRASCQWAAARFGLTGWARNEPDGSVLVEVQGPAEAIQSFLLQLRNSRAGSGIRDESRVSIDAVAGESGFGMF